MALPSLLLSLFFLFVVMDAVTYDGYKLLRFKTSKRLAEWLEEVEANGYEVDEDSGTRRTLIDVWKEASKLFKFSEVLVAPEALPGFLEALKTHGVHQVEVLKENIQDDVNRQRRELDGSRRRRRRSPDDAFHFDTEEYHAYDRMVEFMKKLARQCPSLVSLLNVSTTYEGRTIYGVKISSGGHPVKPSILVDAGIHAREWIAPAVALYIIKKLTSEYERNAQIRKSVDKFDWYIVPQVNPDGYEYSMTTDRFWRKTRSRNITGHKWCVGADANRNWGYRWGEVGANRSPCSNIYAGSFPFSEPEIVGLRDFVTWQIPNLMIYTSLHSYGQVFLSPWGYTSARPDNYLDQRHAARQAVEAIRNTTGASYQSGTISELMYPASGTSIDYMQDRGVPYIYGVELRPLDIENTPAFSLPARYIKPTAEEMLSALLAIGDYAVRTKRL